VQPLQRQDDDTSGLVVKPDIARRQLDEDSKVGPGGTGGGSGGTGTGKGGTDGGKVINGGGPPPGPERKSPKRFYGTVTLDATRVGRDAGRIADEVIAHLSGLVDAKVTVTLEISAEIPSGAPPNVVRAVIENSRTLKFSTQSFEQD
jgi:hypothetical protein